MSNLYNNLCTVRTSMMNVIGYMYITGKPINTTKILRSTANELNDDGFVEEIMSLSKEQLYDLGFEYIHADDTFMLFPTWLYPFIPDGESLLDLSDNEVVIGMDAVELYGDHWVNIGFYHE